MIQVANKNIQSIVKNTKTSLAEFNKSELMQTLINKILIAPVYDIAIKTPLDKVENLSKKLNNNIYIKREDCQPVFSFKCRGAYNKIATLLNYDSKQLKSAGIICASAGNHAQGVAVSAKYLQIQATIVMPAITPKIKVDAVRRFGGDFVNIILFGENFDEAAKYAKNIQLEKGMIFIHPFDDIDVIAGQGTVGKEIIEQLRDIDIVFVQAGGGGLLAGVAAYIKYLKPNIKIVCVEHEESSSMSTSLLNGSNTTLEHVGMFADGVAVKRVGDKTFDICQHVVDEVITVTTDEICAAINQVFDETRSICEPSGAISLAGINKYLEYSELQNQNLVAIISGANMNFDRLRHVTERTAIGSKSECLLGVTMPEAAGSFKKLCKIVSQRSITEFNYRYNNTTQANIFIGISLSGGVDAKSEINEITNALTQNNYQVSNLSDDDTTKLHLRYMVGGKISNKAEILYRVEFPERSGALLHFLEKIGEHNITLFHYRNHGSDYGRVLIAIEKPKDVAYLEKLLDNIGYYYVNESNNPAYQLFL